MAFGPILKPKITGQIVALAAGLNRAAASASPQSRSRRARGWGMLTGAAPGSLTSSSNSAR